MQTTCSQGRNDYEHEMDNNSADLQKQIADLRSQIAQLRADKTEKRSKKPQKEAKKNTSTTTHDKPEQIPQIAAV